MTARPSGSRKVVPPFSDQHPYWEENGGTTFRDPDGRAVIYVSWVYGRDPQPSDPRHEEPTDS